jgi:predicted HD phosphohydrolase
MAAATMNSEKVTNDLIHLLEERGTGDYIGESISQLEHCLQCAHFGVKTGSDDETVIAALLHDIGQFLPLDAAKDVQMGMGDHSVGRVGHETIGEEYLKGLGFGERVSRLVGSHVAAKRYTQPALQIFVLFKRSVQVSDHVSRYLTAVDASYYDGLSEASKQSLRFQGGPFQGEDLQAFERDPLKDEMVKLRKWDDQAKIVGIQSETPRAEMYRDMIVRHLEGRS